MNTESVKQYSENYDMLPDGARVLCAVSGGADSVALLHVLKSVQKLTVFCAHFNHCLRGAESERDEDFVKELCARLGVPCFTGRADVAAYAEENGLGIEIAARRLRYEFLERTAEEQDCSRIATAHNADDNAETLLMHLLRGSGLKGLCGIPPVRGNIVRPLLNVPRSEIEAYLAEHGLSHVEDSSNGSDDYTRNRIRHQLLPLLGELNGNAAGNICTAAELLREDEAFLSGLAEDFLAEYREENTLPLQKLLELPKPVAMRALRAMCGTDIARAHLDAVYMLCLNRAVHADADIPGMRVTKEYDLLTFGTESAPEPLPERELRPGETVELPEIGKRIACTETILSKEIHNSFNTFCFKHANICGRLYVASRRAGDSVRLSGRGCTKTLKKLFSEAGLSLEARTMTPVIYDDAGVAAVCGFGMAERLTAQPGDPVIIVEIQDLK